jgi:hypothetical protein
MTGNGSGTAGWPSLAAALLTSLALAACTPGVDVARPSGPEAAASPIATGPGGVASIEITPETSTIVVGATQDYSAVARNFSGDALERIAFEWASAMPEVATILPGAEGGIATGVSAGTTMITASAGGIVSDPAVLNVAGAGGVVLDCGDRATTVYGWEGTVAWSYELERAGMSQIYQPEERQTVILSQSANLSIRAHDAEIYPGPEGSPSAVNWFASRITGSVSVDDQSICGTCDEGPVEDDFYAQGTGPPVTEGAGGRASRDPNFSNFVLTVLFDECTYSFNAHAFVDGVNSQHPDMPHVYAGSAWLAYDPSPQVRSIPAQDLTLSSSGSFPVAYEGYGADVENDDLLQLGGLSGDVQFHGLGLSGDSSGTVSWSLTPILTPLT